MDMLCTDKTGTLTKNELTLGDIRSRRRGLRATISFWRRCWRRGATRRTRSMRRSSLARRPAKSLSAYAVTAFHPFDPVAKRAEADDRA